MWNSNNVCLLGFVEKHMRIWRTYEMVHTKVVWLKWVACEYKAPDSDRSFQVWVQGPSLIHVLPSLWIGSLHCLLVHICFRKICKSSAISLHSVKAPKSSHSQSPTPPCVQGCWDWWVLWDPFSWSLMNSGCVVSGPGLGWDEQGTKLRTLFQAKS